MRLRADARSHPRSGGLQSDWQHTHSLSVIVQGIVPAGEWDAFIAQLRTPLPTTFRINGRGKFAADLRNRLEQDFFSQFKEPVEVTTAASPCNRKPLSGALLLMRWQRHCKAALTGYGRVCDLQRPW